MPETMSKETTGQSISFDAIKNWIGVSGKDPGMVQRRGKETGDY